MDRHEPGRNAASRDCESAARRGLIVARVALVALVTLPLQPLATLAAQPDGRGTFVITGPRDVRLPAPMAEERAAPAADRAFLERIIDLYGTDRPLPLERGDAVVFWNELTTRLGLASGMPPPRLARAYALTHLATYDALVAADDPRRGGIDADAAAAGAASAVMLYLFPADGVDIRDAVASRMSHPSPDDVHRGILLGRRVGRLVVDYARRDGADGARGGRRNVTTGWIGNAPVLPSAGSWRTWIATSGDEFQPPPPYALDSTEDLREVEAVYAVSLVRTAQQIAAVHRWADWPPPTLWNDELNRRLESARLPLLDAARSSAYLNVAMHDAFVSCWRSKYRYWTARPYMRLRDRDPMFTTVITTPNFPSYTSGHSTVSGAAAVVLAEVFPDAAAYFHGQAEEAALSRFWGGIHFTQDNQAGLDVGRRIGEKAVQRMRRSTLPAAELAAGNGR